MYDKFQEILDTILRNKSRSFLTGFGVLWGVFMLVALIAGGDGLRQMLSKNFEGFAANAAIVWAQPTTKAFKGFPKGRRWDLSADDAQLLMRRVPGLDVVAPCIYGRSEDAVYGNRKYSVSITGVTPDEVRVTLPKPMYGRYINNGDVAAGRKVCYIGDRVYSELFGGGDPTGQRIRVGNIYYEVIGVERPGSSGMSMGGQTASKVQIPIAIAAKLYGRGSHVDQLSIAGQAGTNMKVAGDRIRQLLGEKHLVSPDDERAMTLFNTAALFGMMDNMFRGVNFLIWLVGLGTLLAGAIGVSNIMMVTVRERTSEIGIRRAIGASPRNIMSQIVAESMLLTFVAGVFGILLAVGVMQAADTIAEAFDTGVRFAVGFGTALTAAAMLALLGAVAGLAPAIRAMRIKPVEAMSEK